MVATVLYAYYYLSPRIYHNASGKFPRNYYVPTRVILMVPRVSNPTVQFPLTRAVSLAIYYDAGTIIPQGRRLTPTVFNVFLAACRDGGTRTLTPCGTRSLVWSVYQFQHIPMMNFVEPSGVEPLPMDFQSIVR